MAYSLLSKHAVSLYIFGQIGKMFLFYSLMPGYSARQAKLEVGFSDPPTSPPYRGVLVPGTTVLSGYR